MESSLNLELYNASTPKIVRLQKTGIYFSSKKTHGFVPKYGPPIPFRKLPLCPSKIAMRGWVKTLVPSEPQNSW